MMFKWLTDMFEDDRCECRGCMVTRYGWGYAPCSNAKAVEIRPPQERPTKKPPRKL